MRYDRRCAELTEQEIADKVRSYIQGVPRSPLITKSEAYFWPQ